MHGKLNTGKDQRGDTQLEGRIGHQIIRVFDSILVFGGTDDLGNFCSSVLVLDTETNCTHSLVTQNELLIECFAICSFRGQIYLWGGNRLDSHSEEAKESNALTVFNGSCFTEVDQFGKVPSCRSNMAFALMAHNYLIVYGGQREDNFLNDWHMLDLRTCTWVTLLASLVLPHAFTSRMEWLHGNGLLVLNQPNFTPATLLFFSFRIKDFNNYRVKVSALSFNLGPSSFLHTISACCRIDLCHALLFSTHSVFDQQPNQSCWIYDGSRFTFEKFVKIKFNQRDLFQAAFVGTKLFLIGGYCQKDSLSPKNEIIQLSLNNQKGLFKSHICGACDLRFNLAVEYCPPTYIFTPPSKQFDNEYFLRMENRIIAKMASTIATPFMAVLSLLEFLFVLRPKRIAISLTERSSDLELTLCLQPLFCTTILPTRLLKALFLLTNAPLEPVLEEIVLQAKFAAFHLGPSCLFVLKTAENTTFVVFFSCLITQCPETPFCPTNCIYYFISLCKPSSPLNREIIFRNLTNYFSSFVQYQSLENAVFIFGAQNICQCKQQITTYFQKNQQFFSFHNKQCDKRLGCLFSFLRLSFLRDYKMQMLNQKIFTLNQAQEKNKSNQLPQLWISGKRIECKDMFQVLDKDAKANELSEINNMTISGALQKIIVRVKLYLPRQSASIRGVALFCKGKFIQHKLSHSDFLSGAIQLRNDVPLPLGQSSLYPREQSLLYDFLTPYQCLKRQLL